MAGRVTGGGLPAGRSEAQIAYLPGAGGVRLRTALWPAHGVAPRGTVLLLQGLAEFVEKYEALAAGLQARGMEVRSFDWRGQGGSTRMLPNLRKAHVQDFGAYLADLAAVRTAWLDDAPRPHFLLAHSMGAHLALRVLAEEPDWVAAGVLSAPMLGVHAGRWPAWLAPCAAALAVRAGLGRRFVPGGRELDLRRIHFADNPYTGHEPGFAALRWLTETRPELAIGAATIAWLAAAYRSMSALHAPGVAEGITTPLTVLLAGDERVVRNDAARAFAARLPHGRVVELGAARHELLLEAPAVLEQVWAEIDRRLGLPIGGG